MMKYPVLRFLLPHALVSVLFALISLAYFYPLLSNKYLEQSDIVQYKGMQRQILEHRAEFDEEPYWIDNAFVGMPTYQITGRYPYDVLRYVDSVLRFLPRPADMLFLYLFFSISLHKVGAFLSLFLLQAHLPTVFRHITSSF